jgi:hypothetical protein
MGRRSERHQGRSAADVRAKRIEGRVMKRFSVLLGVAGVVVLGLLVLYEPGDRSKEECTSMSSEEYHYRQATTTPYSAFMRQE